MMIEAQLIINPMSEDNNKFTFSKNSMCFQIIGSREYMNCRLNEMLHSLDVTKLTSVVFNHYENDP